MANNTSNSPALIRRDVWASDIQKNLEDMLVATMFVETLAEGEFPDGDTFHLPSIGDAQVYTYVEGSDVDYRPLSTGEFLFEINEYPVSPTYITKKLMQDSMYMSRVDATFASKQVRAILEYFETRVFAVADAANRGTNDTVVINGARHRFAGGGTNGEILLTDFAYAKFALDTAKVPSVGRVAIVDSSTELQMNLLMSANLAYNPKWEGIVPEGFATGMRFSSTIFGFDVYVSNYLPTANDAALPKASGATTVDFSTTPGKVNLFFSTDAEAMPLVAAWREKPALEYDYNKDKQRHEYLTVARFGVGLQRPEAIVAIVSASPVVA